MPNSTIIGEHTLFGTSGQGAPPRVGDGCSIGRFCIVENDVTIGDHFTMDDYCAVYRGVVIASNVRLLYGKRIYPKSRIGNDCIIGGNIPERCVLADRVTFMGEVAHSHYRPKSDWDATDEPSPEIGEGSVIGVNALLVGGIKIGRNCYVGAGEIVRTDLPDDSFLMKGQIRAISSAKGLFTTRY